MVKKPTKKPAGKPPATHTSPLLPPPTELERVCKGLAALDAMMSEEWEDRYYSFTTTWNLKGKERMASMRNGSGDDWFIVFSPHGVFVKSFWHEYEHEDVGAIYEGIPPKLLPLVTEAAFSMEDVTFGGWHDGTKWTLRGNAKPLAEDFEVLGGDPAAYRRYAAQYFEEELPIAAIRQILEGKRLDTKLVERITTERTLADLKDDLAEIGYGA